MTQIINLEQIPTEGRRKSVRKGKVLIASGISPTLAPYWFPIIRSLYENNYDVDMLVLPLTRFYLSHLKQYLRGFDFGFAEVPNTKWRTLSRFIWEPATFPMTKGVHVYQTTSYFSANFPGYTHYSSSNNLCRSEHIMLDLLQQAGVGLVPPSISDPLIEREQINNSASTSVVIPYVDDNCFCHDSFRYTFPPANVEPTSPKDVTSSLNYADILPISMGARRLTSPYNHISLFRILCGMGATTTLVPPVSYRRLDYIDPTRVNPGLFLGRYSR